MEKEWIPYRTTDTIFFITSTNKSKCNSNDCREKRDRVTGYYKTTAEGHLSTERERETETERDRDREIERERERERQTDRQTDRQTGRQADRQRQTDRQTDRQIQMQRQRGETDRQRHTDFF